MCVCGGAVRGEDKCTSRPAGRYRTSYVYLKRKIYGRCSVSFALADADFNNPPVVVSSGDLSLIPKIDSRRALQPLVFQVSFP